MESEEGRGTCFTVRLPRRQEGVVEQAATPGDEAPVVEAGLYAAAPVNVEQHLSDVVATDDNDKPEVLVIDDNDDVRDTTCATLHKDQ